MKVDRKEIGVIGALGAIRSLIEAVQAAWVLLIKFMALLGRWLYRFIIRIFLTKQIIV